MSLMEVIQFGESKVRAVPLICLLGPLPRARMQKVCEEVLVSTHTATQANLHDNVASLVAAVMDACQGTNCGREGARCDGSWGWASQLKTEIGIGCNCGCFRLWRAILRTLTFGLCCFFVNASPNCSLCPRYMEISRDLRRALRREEVCIDASNLKRLVTGIIIWGKDDAIMASSESCTIYPSILQTFSPPSHRLVIFSLVEGRIVHRNRYHGELLTIDSSDRPPALKSLKTDCIRPSHIGVQSGIPLLTIQEDFDHLKLLCSIQFAGNETKISLPRVVLGYMRMQWSKPCTHPGTEPLDTSRYSAMATSIASPLAQQGLGVAMTRGNPVAQFFCCRNKELGLHSQAVFQKDCCLNCTAEPWRGVENVKVVIICA